MLEPMSTVAAKAAVSKLVSESLVGVLNKFKKSEFDVESASDNIYKSIEKLKIVKTIWQTEKPVNIESFYCEQFAVVEGKRTKITKISDLGNKDYVVIEGIAGQGKSILLRHLASSELERGRLIPVFIELRNIKESQTLLDIMVDNLSLMLKCKISVDHIAKLSSNNRLCFLLDGFDEIIRSKRNDIVNELERLRSEIEGIIVIVTSRPNFGLEASPYFSVIKLSDIIDNEYKSYIYKLSDDNESANQLIDKIEGNVGGIKALLFTPLMITLMVITYKARQVIPDSMAEFYDSLLLILLQRHDGVKPSYTREKNCLISDPEFRQLFETLCFRSKKYINELFSYEELYKWAVFAIEHNKINAKADLFIKDIINVTCLVLKEGTEYKFIHSTMRDFYSAAYVKNSEDELAYKFYDALRANWSEIWYQEVKFLGQIDKYRYLKHYKSRLLADFFEINVGQIENFSNFGGLVKKYLNGFSYITSIDNRYDGNGVSFSSEIYALIYDTSVDMFELTMELLGLAVVNVDGGVASMLYNGSDFDITAFNVRDSTITIPLLSLHSNEVTKQIVEKFAFESLRVLHTILVDCDVYIKSEDSKSSIVDMLF